MKKLLLLCVLALGAVAGRADDRSAQILRKISETLNGYKNYEVAFSFVVRDSPQDVSSPMTGRYIVGGEKYYIDLDQRRVYSDGKTKYEVDKQLREVTVDRVNPADRSFLANPTRAFEFLDGTFTHRMDDPATVGARSLQVIALDAVDKMSGLSDAKLYVDPATGLPAEIVYYIGNSTAQVDVTIHKISPLPSVDPKVFAFDKNQYKDFELIDFR